MEGRSAATGLTETPRAGALAAVDEATLLRWSALACGLLAALLWMGPWLWRVDLFSEDAAQHVFWFWRYLDPSLFRGDLAADYFGSISVAPWGYRALYAVLVPWTDPQTAAELVALGLLGASLLLAWRLGAALGEDDRELRGLVAVAATIALIVFRPADLFTPMGLQRTFALPITLLCAWALVTRRAGWAAASWLLAALFYPVIVPVLGLASVLVFAFDLLRDRMLPRLWWLCVLFGAAAIALVLSSSAPPAWAGPTVTYDQAISMPEFGPGGRLDLRGGSAYGHWIRDHRYGIGWPAPLLLLFGASVVLLYRLRRAALIALPLWSLAVTGVLLWALAHLTLFDLYLPNRHSRTSVAVFGIAALAALGSVVIARLGARPANRRNVRVVAAACAPLVVASLLIAGSWTWVSRPADEDLERTYAYLRTLPPDTLVAAHPMLADFIPLRSARSVLASNETALPFMLGYYQHARPRMTASLRAAYAKDYEELVAILAPYGVDVMVGVRNPSADGLPEPFHTLDESLREGGPAGAPGAFTAPADRVLFRSGDYVVVRIAGREPP